jgi:hypothetical protein
MRSMHGNAPKLRAIPLGAAIACAAGAAFADPPTVLYSLTDDFSYTQGCFYNPGDIHQCLCPISWAEQFGGTFGLTLVPGGGPDFVTYEISGIDWVVGLGENIAITGSGTYEIGTDQNGNPVQRMTLDLFFDGFGPVAYESGLIPGGDDGYPPEIVVPLSDGYYCAGRRITVGASPAGSAPADVAPPGGDGIVGVGDFLAVLGDWGLPGPRATDIDGSGTVDIGDVLLVLGGWTGSD